MSFVLFVEDDEDLRAFYLQAAKLVGISGATARNGAEALTLLDQCSVLPDFILLDLIMPVMDGRTLFETLQELPAYREIPVVWSSAYMDLAPAGTRHLRKPANLEQMHELLKKFCGPSSFTPQSAL